MSSRSWPLFLLAFLGFFLPSVFADDVLETNGFSSCMNNSAITVTAMNIQFDRTTNKVVYNLAGSSNEIQNVTASLDISAYGKQIKNMTFDPCTPNKVPQLCPVPKGSFAAQGSWTIPSQYASEIPAIAYSIPNLDGESKIQLISNNGGSGNGTAIACYETSVTNSKSIQLPAVSWVAAGIAGAALVVTGLSAISAAVSGAGAGAAAPSPTFGEVVFYFQGIATNGMLSVQYPSVYRSFTQNFGFSTGLFGIENIQNSIDNFRAATGGNLTDDSVQALQNSTLVYAQPGQSLSRRATSAFGDLFENFALAARQNSMTTDINGTSSSLGGGNTGGSAANSTLPPNKEQKLVTGIEAYVNALAVPNGNTFMTCLLVFAIVLAAVIAGILLLKVILEAWALFGRFPQKLTSFRKNYWWLIAKTVTNLILLLYGVWVLYCVYQFRLGDSWAAKLLAGITLAIFTAVLIGFTVKIFVMAQKFKKLNGTSHGLYENKETWRKYSIFYDNFKKGYWWMFVPSIIFMFAKGVILAGADGDSDNHSLAQTAALLIVDSIFLLLLLFLRPYELKSGNWVNICVQIVRVISVVCILVFVEQLGFSQTTKTVTGVVLIVVQASLTGVLGILIGINAIVNCVRMNPHRAARKAAEKQRDLDTLTPLDARNSLLMYPMEKRGDATVTELSQHQRGRSQGGYDMLPLRDESKDGLLSNVESRSRSISREPALPKLDFYDSSRSHSPFEMNRQPQLPDLDYRPGPGTAL